MEKTYDHTQEEKIYKAWEKAGVFAASTTAGKKGKRAYTILMPPPNANASLHAGHGMYTVDDIMIRFKRMQGYAALWIPGMDHAGFETQYVYEKQLAKEGRSRLDFDRQTLYDKVFEFVKANSGLIYEQFKRLGFSADWSRSVFTLDKHVIEQVFFTFKKMAEEGLVYRSDYMVNFCTSCGTSLAELEVKHQERVDPLYFIKYGPITVATVRPETMFGDVAVAVNPKDKRYTDLVGKMVALPLTKREIPVVADEMVDMEFGTGAVKITPAHDNNDFEVAKRHNLPLIKVIDETGRLRLPLDANLAEADGKKVFTAREMTVKALEKLGVIEKVDQNYNHAVTVCYKCGRDLEPMVIPNWFIKVEPLKAKVIEAVEKKKTTFYPKRFTKHFLTWMEMMHDWPISRQIAWGIRIPVWYGVVENPEMVVTFLDKTGRKVSGGVGELRGNYSFEEIWAGLQTLTAPKEATYVISAEKPEGEFLQETDTFDTWFSSGQWPLVTLKGGEMRKRFPTDFMGTLSDILKFWISRMMMFSLYLKDEVPFRQVYLWPMVADAKGTKMSKSKGNVVNPIELVEKYGADAFRMSLLFGTGSGGKVILAEDKVRAMRNFANKIWNAARFVREFSGEAKDNAAFKTWYTKTVPQKMTGYLDELKLGQAAEFIYESFWHDFCDYRIEEAKRGKINAKQLREALAVLLKLMHPFVPFVTEVVWKELGEKEMLITSEWPL